MSCIAYQFKCCFGPYACSCFCVRPVRVSTTTRAMYSLMLIIVSVLMTCLHEKRFLNLIIDNLGDAFNSTCVILQADNECSRLFGYISVYRVAFTFFGFHLLMMILCIWVSTGEVWRGKIHNGFWFFKILLIGAIWSCFYLFPIVESYIRITTIVGVVGAFLFIVIQHVSLIDFAYETNEYFRKKSEKNCCFDVLLIACTAILYLLSISGYILIYIHFASHPICVKNRIVIFVNACATFLLVLFSFLITKHLRYKLFLPAAITSLFVTFITWTAISSAPYQMVPLSYKPDNAEQLMSIQPYNNETKLFLCKPEFAQYDSHLAKELHSYLGILIMLLAAVYSSVRSTSEYHRYGIKPARSKNSTHKAFSQNYLPTIGEDIELEEIKTKSRNRRSGSHLMELTSNNDKVGIESGSKKINKTTSLPAINSASQASTSSKKVVKVSKSTASIKSVSQSQGIDNKSKAIKKKKIRTMRSSKNNRKPIDKEVSVDMQGSQTYIEDTLKNYPIDRFLIHDEYFSVRYSYSWLHFVFGLAYLFVMVQLTNWYSPETSHIFTFQHSWPSMWMKITTSWIALFLYGWTLFCPAFCIGRKLYEFPLNSLQRLRNNNKTNKPIKGNSESLLSLDVSYRQ